jgi:hypothetical protein
MLSVPAAGGEHCTVLHSVNAAIGADWSDMSIQEAQPVTATYTPVRTVLIDPDFESRWSAWVARGLAQDIIMRRKLRTFAGVVAIASVILFGLFR